MFEETHSPDEKEIISVATRTKNVFMSIFVVIALTSLTLFLIAAGLWSLSVITSSIAAFFGAIGATGYGGLIRS